MAPAKGGTLSPQARAKLAAFHRGKTHSVESRLKMSRSRTGLKPSLATRQKMSQWQIGKTVSQATKDKIAAALKGRTLPEDVKRKIGLGSKGKKRSAQTRARISAVQKGKVIPLDVRKKMSLAHQGKPGRKHTLEELAKMTGRRHTPAELVKMSESMKRHWAQVKRGFVLAWKQRGWFTAIQYRNNERQFVPAIDPLKRTPPEKLIQIIEHLPSIQKRIIFEHFGIQGNEKTLEKIAAETRIPLQQIQQQFEIALQTLRNQIDR